MNLRNLAGTASQAPICLVGLLIAPVTVEGADKCQAISDFVGQAANGKPAIVATLKKKPGDQLFLTRVER
jgi:hypothetical protein